MPPRVDLVWFRQDLRRDDQPALAAAQGKVVGLYVLDEAAAGAWGHGGASRWWLHHTLKYFEEDLARAGGVLILRRGDMVDEVMALAAALAVDAVHATRHYEPWHRRAEDSLAERLKARGCRLVLHPPSLLHTPGALHTKAGSPYKVFTPFWRALAAPGRVAPPQAAPPRLDRPRRLPASDKVEDWRLLPTAPDWSGGLRATWTPGAAAAQRRLDEFLGRAAHYAAMRDRPDWQGTSLLSPHLHFGEISPRRIWHRLGHVLGPQAAPFLRQLAWRDFCAHLLAADPDLAQRSSNPRFRAFPWASDHPQLAAWRRGNTGYPIIDAGMRALWTTGWLHNRVRMLVASFLAKHMLVHWRVGAQWFWDTLVDADLANNSAGWQWVAGSGADAAPYFRIFNPIAQGAKFDPEGAYVRRWLPALAKLPAPYIHAPWTAPPLILEEAGVRLGRTYPQPILDHGLARKAALAAYARVKGG
ncbi:MAG: cryptochrome/photolyase family protein [Pseudomonadota bacterium]